MTPTASTRGGKGLIPVGVFSGTYRELVFDAAEITGSSLAFEGAGITHKAPHLEDLDGAGARDSVSHYRIPETSLTSASVEGCLTGETSSGIFFTGCGLVNIVLPEDSETGGKGRRNKLYLVPFGPLKCLSLQWERHFSSLLDARPGWSKTGDSATVSLSRPIWSRPGWARVR